MNVDWHDFVFRLVTSGIALRYWNELYVDPAAAAALRQTGRLNAPGDWARVVEDWGKG